MRPTHLIQMRLLHKSLICAVLSLLSPTSIRAQEVSSYSTSSMSELLERLKGNLEVQRATLLASSRFEVVFVPGILGSQLSVNGKTFGIDAPDSSWLSFQPSQSVRVATLNSFRVAGFLGVNSVEFLRQDIYGKGLDLLAYSLNTTPIEFAYDWRDDLQRTTESFAKLMSSEKLKGKRVLIVAHSMGGLVVWNWLKMTERSKRDATVVGAVFLGTPLAGSCEPVRMLLGGYSAIEDSDVWEAIATKVVFRNARAAMFTFPSLFAILPKKKCLSRLMTDGSFLPIDQFSETFWLGREGAAKGLSLGLHSSAKLSREEFVTRVRRALAAGKAFRESFDTSAPDVPVFTLYSNSREMSASIVVDERKDWYRIVENTSVKEHNGDGRVLSESAMNLDELISDPAAFAYEIDLDHGALLSDPKFSRFVRNVLTKRVKERVYASSVLGAIVGGNPSESAMGEKQLIEFDPKSWGAQVTKQDSLTQQALAKFNLLQIDPFGSSKSSKDRGRNFAANSLKAGKFETASTIYDSLYTVDAESFDESDAVSAANAKLNAGDIDGAIHYAVVGYQIILRTGNRLELANYRRRMRNIFSDATVKSENEYVRILARRFLSQVQ